MWGRKSSHPLEDKTSFNESLHYHIVCYKDKTSFMELLPLSIMRMTPRAIRNQFYLPTSYKLRLHLWTTITSEYITSLK